MEPMQLVKLSTSATAPLDLEEVKLALRIDTADDDQTIQGFILAACDFMERRTGYVMRPGIYEVQFDEWPCEEVEFMRAPVREIERIEYMSAKNVWTEIDVDEFQLVRRQRSFVLKAFDEFEPPEVFTALAGIKFQFAAGYDLGDSGFSGESFPLDDGLKTLATMFVGHYYKNRELLGAGSQKSGGDAIEAGLDSLLGAYRGYW